MNTIDNIEEFIVIEKRIDTADETIADASAESVRSRWESGKLILAKRVGKKLPVGLLDELCRELGKSRAELKFRTQFAERCSTDEELANALANYGSWYGITQNLSQMGGEPKPSKPKPGRKTPPRREDAVVSDELIDNIVADIDAGKPHSRKDIADRYGISESTARDPIKTAEGIIKGRNETIDWDSIPGSKQEALERAKRSIRKELEREYAAKLAEAVKEERAQYVESLAQRKAKLDEDFQQMQALASAEYEKYRRINAIQKAKGGIITKAQYLTVIACLHPDNSASPEKRAEAFRIFNDDRVKLLLVKEDSQ